MKIRTTDQLRTAAQIQAEIDHIRAKYHNHLAAQDARHARAVGLAVLAAMALPAVAAALVIILRNL